MAKINLTTIFEHLFGVSEIKDPKQLDLLIEALEEMGDVPFSEDFDLEELARIVEEKKKG